LLHLRGRLLQPAVGEPIPCELILARHQGHGALQRACKRTVASLVRIGSLAFIDGLSIPGG
jgi:hypothetical protein